VRTHFGRSAERFSEGEDDDEDVSLVVRARMSMGNSLASNEDEDEDVNTGVSERGIQQQQASPSKDNSQAHDAAWQCWPPSSHSATYSPFDSAPDLIAPAHTFRVYVSGTMPASELGHSHPSCS